MLLPLCFALSAFSMVLRFRRSAGVERQQLKWFATAAVLLGACFPIVFVVPSGVAASDVVEDLVTLLFVGLPIAIGIAILSYRLYDIDIIVNRALVYGPLTVLLAAGLLRGRVGCSPSSAPSRARGTTLAVVASTLAIAALFNPLRRRIQSLIDRRFYRSKYDARKTLEAFSTDAEGRDGSQAFSNELVGVVRETMQPAHVSLWLRPVGRREPGVGD